MKTFASTILSVALTAGLVSVVAAQGNAPAPTKAPAPAATPAPAAAKAAAPAAAPAKAAPAAAAKAAAPAAAPAKAAAPAAGAKAPVPPPAKPVAPPPAPAEVAALAKVAGNWRCTGTAMGLSGETAKMTAMMRSKLSLDKWWVQTSFAELGGNKYKFESFTTFDPATKKWHRTMVDNMGNQETAMTEGPKDGKVQWDSASRSPSGASVGRHYEDMTNPKELKMWGEYSMDKGKTWMKTYEAACKR